MKVFAKVLVSLSLGFFLSYVGFGITTWQYWVIVAHLLIILALI